MSGGRWGYQQERIKEDAERIAALMEAVAETEHIVDWAASGDTTEEDAGRHLYDLWVKTFDKAFGPRGRW